MKLDRHRHTTAIALVLALHGLAAGLLLSPRRAATPEPQRRVTLQLIAAAPARLPDTPQPPRVATARAPLNGPRAQAAGEAQPTLQAPLSQASASAPTETSPPLASEPVTSSLLTSEATRRAIREAGRQPLLSERAASAAEGDGHETRGARLARQMEKAGIGDCLKGEFAGAGAGLLSLPFLAFAEVRGQCRK